MSIAKKNFSERYWPHLLGLGIGSNIYLRSRKDPGAIDLILGLIGLVMILVGLNGLRTFNRKPKGEVIDQRFEREIPRAKVENKQTAQSKLKPTNKLLQQLKVAPLLYSRRYGIAICGIALIAPMLFVPCTYQYRPPSLSYDRTFSQYRWLWQVENADIKFGVLALEELVVGSLALVIFLQNKRITNS